MKFNLLLIDLSVLVSGLIYARHASRRFFAHSNALSIDEVHLRNNKKKYELKNVLSKAPLNNDYPTLHLIRWSGPYTSETSPQVMFVTLTMSFLPLFYNRTHIPGYVGLLLLLVLFLLRYRLADVLSNMVALISCSMT